MKNEALQNGYHEAIALDSSGHVAEATVANIFLIKNGELITPDTADDILEGITRRSLFELAGHLGIPCRHGQIDRTEIYIADELLLCGSSAGVTPVLSVDHRRVGSGSIGPITARLIREYDLIRTGTHADFAHWLTAVDPEGAHQP
jgi:branched-chain amino acid aminotransferase